MTTALRERMSRIARELAEVVAASDQPAEALSQFVTTMSVDHRIDVRKVPTFAERWDAGNRMTDEQVREYIAAAKAAFTDADAEKYLSDEPMFPFEDVIAELEAIHRRHEQGA